MINSLTKNYYFNCFIKDSNKYEHKGKVKAVFYGGFPSGASYFADKELFNLELDEEDIEYLKNKYILTELEYTKEKLNQKLNDVEVLRRQIKDLEIPQ